MEQLEVLTEVQDLRKVWPHEALDFTPWLAKDENIAILGNEIGMEIAVDGTESAVGDFSVDIIATDIATGQKVIIENQLEDTNHDHLGKLITYAAGKDAQTIIWVVKHAREEHRAAIEWLNNHTDDDIGFFLCEIHLYKVGSSNPAVKFSVIEKPNDWIKSVKKNQQQTEQEDQDKIGAAPARSGGFRSVKQAEQIKDEQKENDRQSEQNRHDIRINHAYRKICGTPSLRQKLFLFHFKDSPSLFFRF